MALKPDQLAGALKRGLPPVVWIHGDEPLLVIEATDLARAAARAQGFTERVALEADRYFKPEQWLQEAGALSLFAERKIIEIRIPAKPRADLVESVAQWLKSNPGDDVFLLLSGPRPEKAMLTSAGFKTIESTGIVVQIFPVAYRELTDWLARRLHQQGQQADRDLLTMIAERVDGNLLAASQEIRKLGLLFPEGRLPTEQAAAAVLEVARFDGRDLVDSILSADGARAQRCLDGLRASGQADVAVIWQLADCARSLLRLREALDAGEQISQNLLRQIRAWGPRQRLYEQCARRVSTRQAQLALTDAARADTIAKGFEAGDSWHLIEQITRRLAGHRPLEQPRLTPI